MNIRLYQPTDLPELRRMTVEGFDGIAIDQNVEKKLGILAGHDWRWRKSRHVDDDCGANPTGVFVAEENGVLLGYISTRMNHESGKGRIPNLAVDETARGRGVGRTLIGHAVEYFRREGMRSR